MLLIPGEVQRMRETSVPPGSPVRVIETDDLYELLQPELGRAGQLSFRLLGELRGAHCALLLVGLRHRRVFRCPDAKDFPAQVSLIDRKRGGSPVLLRLECVEGTPDGIVLHVSPGGLRSFITPDHDLRVLLTPHETKDVVFLDFTEASIRHLTEQPPTAPLPAA